MGYLKKIEAKLQLQLGDEDLEKMGLVRLSETKVVPLAEFSKMENASIDGYRIQELIVDHPKVKLPPGLKILGNLNLMRTWVTKLPPGLKVGGYLDLSETSQIKKLPPGLEVGGGLFLIKTLITKLPAGLQVGGELRLSGTKITELPAGLKVGRDLDLRWTKIQELPEDLQVKGKIKISRDMKPNFKPGKFKNKIMVLL